MHAQACARTYLYVQDASKDPVSIIAEIEKLAEAGAKEGGPLTAGDVPLQWLWKDGVDPTFNEACLRICLGMWMHRSISAATNMFSRTPWRSTATRHVCTDLCTGMQVKMQMYHHACAYAWTETSGLNMRSETCA